MPDAQTPVLTNPRARAVKLLRAEAASICDCHTIDGKDWAGEPDAKAAHDEMLAVADALATQAPPGPPAVSLTPRGWDAPQHPFRAVVQKVQKLGRVDEHHLVVQGATTVADCGIAGKAFSPQHKAWSLAIAQLLNSAHVATTAKHAHPSPSRMAVMQQALDLLCGLHPCCTADDDNPLAVAQSIFDAVMAEHKALTDQIESAQKTIDWLSQRSALSATMEKSCPATR